MIKEAVAEDKGVHVNEDDFNRVVAGMQANGISSGKLEDGELEEEPESAQAYLNSDSTERFCVREQRTRLSSSNAHVVGRDLRLASPRTKNP